MLTPTRRRLAAVAMVLLVPTLGACGSFSYQTDQVYQPGVGVNNREGSIDVLGAVVVSSTDGEGTFVASLVNQADTDDSLESMDGDDILAQISSPVEVKADTLVNLADTGAVSVTGEDVSPGAFVRLTLKFESGQSTELNVPVVPDEDEFSEVEPASPGGSSESSPSASPSASPSP